MGRIQVDSLFALTGAIWLLYSGWLTLRPLFARDITSLATSIFSGTYWDAGTTSIFDQERARELVHETRSARFGLGFLYLGVIATAASAMSRGVFSLPVWLVGVVPAACAGDWYLARPWMEHRMFIRTWLDFVARNVPDPFDYSHGGVADAAWTHRSHVPELCEFMRPWLQGSAPYSPLRLKDKLNIERGVALLARLYGYRPKNPEWGEWLARRNAAGVEDYPLRRSTGDTEATPL